MNQQQQEQAQLGQLFGALFGQLGAAMQQGGMMNVDSVHGGVGSLKPDELAEIHEAVVERLNELSKMDSFNNGEAHRLTEFFSELHSEVKHGAAIGNLLAATDFADVCVKIVQWFLASSIQCFESKTPNSSEETLPTQSTSEASEAMDEDDFEAAVQMMTACWNLTESSLQLSRKLVAVGYHQHLVAILNRKYEESKFEEEFNAALITVVISTIQNMAKASDCAEQLRAVGALEAVKRYMQVQLGYVPLIASLTVSSLQLMQLGQAGAQPAVESESDESDLSEDDDEQQPSEPAVPTVSEPLGQIMISYCHQNKDSVMEVRKQLKEADYKIWMDMDDMGNSLYESMAEAIEGSSVVLICVSEAYKQSINCRSEAEYARDKRKKMIFLKVESEFKQSGWLGFLMAGQLWVDCTGRRTSLAESCQEIIRLLEKVREGGASNASTSKGAKSKKTKKNSQKKAKQTQQQQQQQLLLQQQQQLLQLQMNPLFGMGGMQQTSEGDEQQSEVCRIQ